MGIKHIGNAVFVDDPIEPKEWREALPRVRRKRWGTPGEHAVEWFERMAKEEGLSIRPYVDFPSLERAEIGIALVRRISTTPKEQMELWHDLPVKLEIVDSVELKEVPYFEPMVRYTEASMLEGDEKSWYFEEEPFVEVNDKEDWDKLLESHTSAYGEPHRDYEYEGPGLYDARDMMKQYDSMEDYELTYMEEEADHLVEYMFSGGLMASDLRGDEWVKAFEKLAIRVAEEEEEPEDE